MDDKNTATIIVLEDEVLVIGQDDCCTVSDAYVEWVIDSAASCHVTPRKELFTLYKAGNFGRVKMGNDNLLNYYSRKIFPPFSKLLLEVDGDDNDNNHWPVPLPNV